MKGPLRKEISNKKNCLQFIKNIKNVLSLLLLLLLLLSLLIIHMRKRFQDTFPQGDFIDDCRLNASQACVC